MGEYIGARKNQTNKTSYQAPSHLQKMPYICMPIGLLHWPRGVGTPPTLTLKRKPQFTGGVCVCDFCYYPATCGPNGSWQLLGFCKQDQSLVFGRRPTIILRLPFGAPLSVPSPVGYAVILPDKRGSWLVVICAEVEMLLVTTTTTTSTTTAITCQCHAALITHPLAR